VVSHRAMKKLKFTYKIRLTCLHCWTSRMGVSFALMRTAIDDFPSLSISRLRSAGHIHADAKTATIAFPAPHDATAFVVALSHIRFANGGSWSLFICACGRKARILRLDPGSSTLVCHGCLSARGFRPRVQLIATPARAAHTAPRRIAQLTAAPATPARLKPRPGRRLDRRSRIEAALRRSLIVARQSALDEHDLRLVRLARLWDK